MRKFLTTAVALAAAATMATSAIAQDAISPDTWEYGPRDVVEGEIEIWNTAKQKIMNGEDLVGGTITATDPRTYCAMANAGYDFTWVEMQHEAISWESVARMWATCPDASAVPGVRIAYTDEREIQHALDSGALVLVVPTVDSAEEAREVVSWARFPPLGRHSQGGGQRWSMYEDVPGGYRATANENVVIIVMIETIEGVSEIEEIAQVEGIDGIFIASGDLGNFSGYAQGEEQYERLVTAIEDAVEGSGKALCGPLAWRASREGYTCFQAGSEPGIIRRGVEAELAATARPGEAAAAPAAN